LIKLIGKQTADQDDVDGTFREWEAVISNFPECLIKKKEGKEKNCYGNQGSSESQSQGYGRRVRGAVTS